MSEVVKHSEVNLRKANPSLYQLIMVFAITRIALAVNFWISNPTFNPYDISKTLVGWIFFLLGISQIVFLHIWRDLRKIRLVIAVSAGVMLCWGLVNTQQSVAGKASWQLPIIFIGFAALQMVALLEAPVNPMMEKE